MVCRVQFKGMRSEMQKEVVHAEIEQEPLKFRDETWTFMNLDLFSWENLLMMTIIICLVRIMTISIIL